MIDAKPWESITSTSTVPSQAFQHQTTSSRETQISTSLLSLVQLPQCPAQIRTTLAVCCILATRTWRVKTNHSSMGAEEYIAVAQTTSRLTMNNSSQEEVVDQTTAITLAPIHLSAIARPTTLEDRSHSTTLTRRTASVTNNSASVTNRSIPSATPHLWMKFKLLFFKRKSSLVKMVRLPTMLLDSHQRSQSRLTQISRLRDWERPQRSSVTWTSHPLTLEEVTQRAA